MEHLSHEPLPRVHGERKHLDPRVRIHDLPRGVDPVELGHTDVHHDHIRHQLESEPDGLAPVSGLADEDDVAPGTDRRGHGVPDDGVIVGQQHADRHGTTSERLRDWSTLNQYEPDTARYTVFRYYTT